MRVTRVAVATAALASAFLISGCGGSAVAPVAAVAPSPGGAVGGTVASDSTVPGSGGPTGAPTGGAAAPSPLARSVPVRLLIPRIGVDTSVIGLGLAPDGTVQVPPIEANAPAGWYRGSPTPGQTGPSVILAHVTVGRYGDGVFVHLSELQRGDQVTVRLQDGASAVFTVDLVQTVAKSQFPTSAVYGNVNRPELRLITCAGQRSSDGSGYLGNLVVYASLTATDR